jgi:formyltetrahydrofolate dehydrogenase
MKTPVKLKIAIIGQSNFASAVLELLLNQGHDVVGVFTIPDKGSREDTVATTAAEYEIPVFKFKSWRLKGKAIPEVLEKYKSVSRMQFITSIPSTI